MKHKRVGLEAIAEKASKCIIAVNLGVIAFSMLGIAFCTGVHVERAVACGIDCPWEDIYPEPIAQFMYQLDIHPAAYPQDGFWEIVVWEDGSFTIGNVSGCVPGMLCSEE